MRPLPLTGHFTAMVLGFFFAIGFVAGPTVPAGIALAQPLGPPDAEVVAYAVVTVGADGGLAIVPTTAPATVPALAPARAPLVAYPAISPPEPDDHPNARALGNPDAPPPSPVEVAAAGKEAIDAVVSATKAEDGSRVLAWMGGVSAILWFLIALARRVGDRFLSGNAIRLATIFGGAAAALLGHLAAGMNWIEVVQVFMAGPGAIAIHELLKLLTPKSASSPS